MHLIQSVITTAGAIATGALTTLSIAQVPTPNPEAAALQFGALGLCALMVGQNFYLINALRKDLESGRLEHNRLLQKDIESRDALSDALRTRPCLHDDRIFHQKG